VRQSLGVRVSHWHDACGAEKPVVIVVFTFRAAGADLGVELVNRKLGAAPQARNAPSSKVNSFGRPTSVEWWATM
jgi:hypothetical protein